VWYPRIITKPTLLIQPILNGRPIFRFYFSGEFLNWYIWSSYHHLLDSTNFLLMGIKSVILFGHYGNIKFFRIY